MNYFKYIKSIMLVALTAGIFTTSNIYINAEAQVSAPQKPVQAQTSTVQYVQVSPLSVVNSPKAYLNKKVEMEAKFDKFSTLGLDYKPALKSSDNYISFLIKRDDTSYSIPLSEMKLFLKREIAEKYIDLKTNDKIKIKGTVFSDALGDAWIDVVELNVIEKAPEENKK